MRRTIEAGRTSLPRHAKLFTTRFSSELRTSSPKRKRVKTKGWSPSSDKSEPNGLSPGGADVQVDSRAARSGRYRPRQARDRNRGDIVADLERVGQVAQRDADDAGDAGGIRAGRFRRPAARDLGRSAGDRGARIR